MNDRESYADIKNNSSMENFTIRITEPLLYDRLRTISDEYSVSTELLINIAVKRLINDIDFVRGLRVGKTKLEQPFK